MTEDTIDPQETQTEILDLTPPRKPYYRPKNATKRRGPAPKPKKRKYRRKPGPKKKRGPKPSGRIPPSRMPTGRPVGRPKGTKTKPLDNMPAEISAEGWATIKKYPNLVVKMTSIKNKEVSADFLHEPDSPFYGLSVEEQLLLAKILRRDNHRLPKYLFRLMRKAKKQDWDKIFNACVKQLVFSSDMFYTKRIDMVCICLRMHHNYRNYLPKSFPKGYIIGCDTWTTVLKYKVDSLLDWLYSEGHAKFSRQEIRKSINKQAKEFDKMVFADLYGTDNALKEFFEGNVTRSERGRT